MRCSIRSDIQPLVPAPPERTLYVIANQCRSTDVAIRPSHRACTQRLVPPAVGRTLVGIRQSLLIEEKVASTDLPRGGCRMRCSIRSDIQPLVPAPPERTLCVIANQCRSTGVAIRLSFGLDDPAPCPTCAGTHAVRDSLASDFPLRETGKSDSGIVQFLNWTMKATYVAFGHDSNPVQGQKRAIPNGMALFWHAVRDSNP